MRGGQGEIVSTVRWLLILLVGCKGKGQNDRVVPRYGTACRNVRNSGGYSSPDVFLQLVLLDDKALDKLIENLP